MTHALAIKGSEEKAHGRTGARPQSGSTHNRAPIAHHKFQSARKTTSLVRRNLGRRFGVGHFIRLGWSFTTDREFSDADCLVKAGVDSRVAAQLIANHTTAPGSIQGISERLPFHSNASFRSSSHASKTTQKRRRELGNLVQGRGHVAQAGGVHD